MASDGGIDFSQDELQSHHESRIRGLDAADFWGFAGGWNVDLLLGGKYHNGNSAHYQTYATGDFAHLGGVEEPTGYTNPYYPQRAVFGHWSGESTERFTVPDEVTGAAQRLPSMSQRARERVGRGEGSLMSFDVYYGDWVYMGREHKLWKSRDGGATWYAAFAFPDSGVVAQFAQSRADPAVFYAFAKSEGRPQQLFRSADHGESFTEVLAPGSNRTRMVLTLDPHDADHLWVSDVYGRTTYQSTDGGSSWTERPMSEFPNDRVSDLLLVHTPQGYVVYACRKRDVLMYESWTQAWRSFDEGLPYIVSSLEFAPFYARRKLRLGTQGRGVWEVELPHELLPQAVPMAARRRVFCKRDTITLESHSILDQADGATFAWSISPAPAYLSDASARRPRVVLDADGQYDVALTVKDAAGRTSTRTVEGLLHLEDRCAVGEAAGMALRLDVGQADVVATPMRADSMTIMMWVRPRQNNNYAALVMRRSGERAVGIHVWENGELGIHHNDSHWWKRSGLLLNYDAWNHVAVTFAPDGATLYLNGKASRITQRLDSLQWIGTVHIGADANWGDDRRISADIDELSIWNRPLSQTEVRSYRHHTLQPAAAPGLVNYYQFDEPALQAYDLVGEGHGSFIRNAGLKLSDAPVAAGRTSSIAALSAGLPTEVPALGLTVTAGDSIRGPLTVSYLEGTPHGRPQRPRMPNGYWIINDYSASAGDTVHGLQLAAVGLDVPSPTTQLLRRAPNDTSRMQWTEHGTGSLEQDRYVFDAVQGGLSGQYTFGTDAVFEVELLAFQGDSLRRQAHLNWQLRGYDARDRYALEHRAPGSSTFRQRFTAGAFGSVDSSYVDTGLVAGLHHYRLALTDADGATLYSEEVGVVIAQRPVVSGVSAFAKSHIAMGPNPVSAGGMLFFSLPAPTALFRIRVYDARGREAARMDAPGAAGATVSTAGLAPGVYFVEIELDEVLAVRQVVVQ